MLGGREHLNKDGTGGVGVMVKDELCEKVVDIRMVSGCVVTIVVVF